MLITGHGPDPSRVFLPAFANIAIVSRQYVPFCAAAASQLDCALGLLFASPLVENGITGLRG